MAWPGLAAVAGGSVVAGSRRIARLERAALPGGLGACPRGMGWLGDGGERPKRGSAHSRGSPRSVSVTAPRGPLATRAGSSLGVIRPAASSALRSFLRSFPEFLSEGHLHCLPLGRSHFSGNFCTPATSSYPSLTGFGIQNAITRFSPFSLSLGNNCFQKKKISPNWGKAAFLLMSLPDSPGRTLVTAT